MKRYRPLLENMYGIKPLIIIPHSGNLIPFEIKTESVIDNMQGFLMSQDLRTDVLYDFSLLFHCDRLVFPMHRSFCDPNESILDIDSSVPLIHWNDKGDTYPIYKKGFEPSKELRKFIASKYIKSFYNKVIQTDKTFIFDGHSSNIGDIGDGGAKFNADIEVTDRQISKEKDKIIRTAPEGYLEEYLKNLDKQLSNFKVKDKKLVIKYNTPFTVNTYGEIEGKFGYDGIQEKGCRVPLLMQELNEYLYTAENEKQEDIIIIAELRRRMGKALFDTLLTMQKYRN